MDGDRDPQPRTASEESHPLRNCAPLMSLGDGLAVYAPDFGAVAEMWAALAAAKGKFSKIVRSREVTIQMKSGGKYTFCYAPMEDIVAATDPALSACGLSVLQPPARPDPDGVVTVHTILAHGGGACMVSTFRLNAAHDIKDLGGQLTYVQRYQRSKLLDIAADQDADDAPSEARGESEASARPRKRQAPAPAKPAKQQAKQEPPKEPEKAQKAPEPEPEQPPPPSDEDAPKRPSARAKQEPEEPEAPAEHVSPTQEQVAELAKLRGELGLDKKAAIRLLLTISGETPDAITSEGADKLIKRLRTMAAEAE